MQNVKFRKDGYLEFHIGPGLSVLQPTAQLRRIRAAIATADAIPTAKKKRLPADELKALREKRKRQKEARKRNHR